MFIRKIFEASYKTRHIPRCWMHSNVIALPKPGKTAYDQIGSYRPITLAPVMLKWMERLVLWHLEETYLDMNPLSPHQYAFREGCGTENALSRVINEIETHIHDNKNKKIVLACFLDIKGAFDNLSHEST